jgi:HD-GYP domain-containing protein (c-di-GMP phosphodiesterase class II)
MSAVKLPAVAHGSIADMLGLMPPLIGQLVASVLVLIWIVAVRQDPAFAMFAAFLLLYASAARVYIEKRARGGIVSEHGAQTAILLITLSVFAVIGAGGGSVVSPVVLILPALVWVLSAIALRRTLADLGALIAIAGAAAMAFMSLSNAGSGVSSDEALLLLGGTLLAAIGAARWHGARTGALWRRMSRAEHNERPSIDMQQLLYTARAEIRHNHDPPAIARAGATALQQAFSPTYVAVVEVASGTSVAVPMIEKSTLAEPAEFGRRLVGLTQRAITTSAGPLWLLIDETHGGDALILHRLGMDGLLIVPLEYFGETIGAIQIAWRHLPSPKVLGETLAFAHELARSLAPSLAVTRHILEIEHGYFDAISSLSESIDNRDPHTRGHSRRVAKYAVWVADQLDLDEDEQRKLFHAAALHDIGRAGISDDILGKPGALTTAEWHVVHRIPIQSAEIVEPISLLTDLRSVILHMHERWDGSGRPDGLSGEEIPILARILAVVDAFDAMTSARPYRSEPLSVREALVQLWNERGTKFDPRIVETFVMRDWADSAGRPIIR